ncbi:MAG: tRNA 2-thiocytidine(32) synthetase TtcA [Gammaproteobacteria bacterium CG11_big_fil_rev_8_21_14_0_20_46_22]|nr:MAG: tRNA 2-thiocytidine(32) synthetase TtcA [Gammaproteobacteria bacterium CG12_big_fil_rev_8_21_14_0_65_46_12]PIR11641.1 MAG: tRNA 2-thiocytidine(32) synthetase TtcA [Gammaproteobacteria bacterium CG11_big_fil_rev_8_21_14_0_20_46_22]
MANIEKLEKKLLHYTGKAIADYALIQHGDRILVCLSGGKDSYTMLWLLRKLQLRAKIRFEITAFTLDQGQPGWHDEGLRSWLKNHQIEHVIHSEDTYSIVTDKIPENKTYCSLCSRLRRGIIYRYAKDHGFNKIALGHHRDDLINTLLMSIFYNGEIKSMPPKLLSDDQSHIVIRPLVYCQEADIAEFAKLMAFPIIPCNLCGSQENLARQRTAALVKALAKDNPKIPSNILHALGSVKPSQLMDKKLWDFNTLEAKQDQPAEATEFPLVFMKREPAPSEN